LKTVLNHFLFLTACGFIFLSCSAPRSVPLSGRVTPAGSIKVGFNYNTSVSTQSVKSAYKGVYKAVNEQIKNDTIIVNNTINDANIAMLAFSLDPVQTGMDFYLRYGLVKHFDLGYKYSGGTHVFDGMWQFLGAVKNDDDVRSHRWFGSVGLQYSSQKKELPSIFGLNKLQQYFGFEFARKDFMIPIIFSKSFGIDEKNGSLSFGIIYNHTFVKYGWGNNQFYTLVKSNSTSTNYIEPVNAKMNFPSFGTFVNVKLGYKFLYFVSSLNVHYQKYGRYHLLGSGQVNLEGFTFVPTVGIQIQPSAFKDWKRKNQ
jgi:hypothetical protein